MDAEKGKVLGVVGIGALGALGIAIAYALTAKAAEKKFACPYCDATFSTIQELQQHILTEHGDHVITITWD